MTPKENMPARRKVEDTIDIEGLQLLLDLLVLHKKQTNSSYYSKYYQGHCISPKGQQEVRIEESLHIQKEDYKSEKLFVRRKVNPTLSFHTPYLDIPSGVAGRELHAKTCTVDCYKRSCL